MSITFREGNASSTFNGWTCQLCKSWVPSGCTHSCPTNAWSQPPWSQSQPTVAGRTDHGFALLALGNRIADLLERLIVVLEQSSRAA
jgi:hypothetical protein